MPDKPFLDAGFWRLHLALPLVLFVLLLGVVEFAGVDFLLANMLFDAGAGAFPARDSYLFKHVFHDLGNRLILCIALGAFAVFLLGFFVHRLRSLRRAAIYVAICIGLAAALAAVAKQTTNMDCPWSLERYGGERPYVSLLSDRPDVLPRGACFPGAHSVGAFALFAFYFVWHRSNPRRAGAALSGATLLGIMYAGTQWARGAHFVSHDIWSALLAWLVCLACYLLFSTRLWPEAIAGSGDQPALVSGTT